MDPDATANRLTHVDESGAARMVDVSGKSVTTRVALATGRVLLSEAVVVKGIKVLAAAVEVDDAKVLRDTGDALRDKLGSGVVVLAGTGGGEIKLVAMVTKDLTDRFHAGKLLQSVAEVVGGRGGGRPDMAQGGGTDATKVPEALARAVELVKQQAMT